VNNDKFNESLLDGMCKLLIAKKENSNYLFQFLNKLYNIILDIGGNAFDRKKLILKYYSLPLTLYANDADSTSYLLNIKTNQQKEIFLKRFLISFNEFSKKYQTREAFPFSFDVTICRSLLNNLVINKDVKLLFLKFIENYLYLCENAECRNLIFMYVCDYYGLNEELNDNLLDIFKFYLNTDQVNS
jgi:hypothetical protein